MEEPKSVSVVDVNPIPTPEGGYPAELFLGNRVKDERVGEKKYTPRCPRHKTYRGLRNPRLGCEICWDVRAFMVKYGIKERRTRSAERFKACVGQPK